MVQSDKLAVLMRLQEIVLNTEDPSSILSTVLPVILSELMGLKLSYQFLSMIFVEQDQIQHSFFVEAQNLAGETQIPPNVFNVYGLFKDKSEWLNVLQGQAGVFAKVDILIDPSYRYYQSVHSVIACPIKMVNRVNGILIFASPRQASDIPTEEVEFLELITHLVALIYRLQDVQNSMTAVSKQVYEMNAQLHQIDKLKDDFVSVASHELRTPLTAIRSYSWMALYRSDVPLTEKLKRYLSRTLISTERLINLVNDMLNISRIESGRVELLPQVLDMVALVKDIFIEVDVKARERNLHLSIEQSEHVPKVFADPDKIRQVLLNLIGNALKFTPPNGNVSVSFFADGVNLDVSVKDSGVGVSKDDLARLFKKFGRLDNSYVAAATSGGTGLGLYICKSLIELSHGRVWASSLGDGKGATFSFSLPIATPKVLAEPQKYTISVGGGQAKTMEPTTI